MIVLHDATSGTPIHYNPALIAQVFEFEGRTYVQTSGTGTYVQESVAEVLDAIAVG